MKQKFSWSGTIVVLLCFACMLYYYLVFHHTIETQYHKNPAEFSKSSI